MEKSYNLHHFQINGADKQAQAKKSAAATERVDCGFLHKENHSLQAFTKV